VGVLFIAVILVSGFIFTNKYPPARFRQKRSTGWDAYFHVAQWGTVIAIASSFLYFLIDKFDVVSVILGWFSETVPSLLKGTGLNNLEIKIGFWVLLTLLIAYLVGVYMDRRYQDPRLLFQIIAEIASKDHMEAIILDSSSTQATVLISLSTRKCYVGICYGDLSYENGESSSLAILPMLSGYRDKDNLGVEFQSNYYSHYEENGIIEGKHEKLTLDHFKVVINKADIETISYFDLETYTKFKQRERQSTS